MADSTGAEEHVPFYCDVEGCPKQSHPYTRREKLNEHIRSQHTGYRLKCPICDKLIIRMGDLKKHMRSSHEGYKPFVCEYGQANRSGCACGARFTKKSSLNRHWRPWIVNEPTEKADNDILSLDVSDLRKTPRLWNAFVEVVESSIIKENIRFLGESSDGLLALCVDTTVGNEADDMELGENVNEQRSRDDIETDLYLRLVRLFRRRGPKTCSDLLEDVLAAFKNSEHECTRLIVESSTFLGQILAILALNRWEPPGFQRVLIEKYDCVIYYSSWTDFARRLGTPWVELVQQDGPFFVARSEAMASWAKCVLPDTKPVPRRERRQASDVAKKRPRAVIQEALTAASCCKSVASGHTNSTLESVRSAPSIFGNDEARPKLNDIAEQEQPDQKPLPPLQPELQNSSFDFAADKSLSLGT